MKTVIKCEKVTKAYKEKLVFESFSYSFKEKGLYVLFGESGSGKTTLLNVITGATDFNEGKVKIYENTYDKEVKYDEVKDYIAYITQNNYFVDYLKVKDNLLLALSDKNEKSKIEEYLKEFKLEDKINSYPGDLSGGEQQRLSIIIALLQNKKIIILDEPTSSLDIDNRELILNILENLKKDHLIIVATHDSKLIEIADKKIGFNNLQSEIDNEEMATMPSVTKNKVNIFKRMIKQLWYKKRNLRASFFLIMVFTLVTIGLSACSDYKQKLRTSLLNIYHINFVNYSCNIGENPDFCDSIINKYNGYNTFLYSDNINIQTEGILITTDYDTSLNVLPFDESKVPVFKDLIAYGSYFENENDIILGQESALRLSDDIASLIGTSYDIELPDKMESFRIAGILKDVDDNKYLKTMGGVQLNYKEFISDKYANKYRDSEHFRQNGNTIRMRAYFKNTLDLNDFYNTYQKDNHGINIEKFNYNFINYNGKMYRLKYFLYPALMASFVVVLLFYYQSENIQNKYRKHILAIYNYYGYNWFNIILSNILTSIISVLSKFIIGAMIGVVIGVILNPILLNKNITNFILFVPDFPNLLLLGGLLIVMATFFSFVNSLLLKKHGWLKSLKEEGDLL